MTQKRYLIGLGLVLGVGFQAQAGAEHAMKFSGFGTLGAAWSSESQADFQVQSSLPDGPGYTRKIDFYNGTRLGLQADATVLPWLSVTAQGLAERRYNKTFSPYLSMAFLKLQPSPELNLRLGRVPASFYLISDYKKVGYSLPWTMPPVEVYQINPITYWDGGDLIWRHKLGSASLAAQAVLGGMKYNYLSSGQLTSVKFEAEAGGTVNLAIGDSTFRVHYDRAKVTADSQNLNGALQLLRSLPPALGGSPALADQFQVQKSRITYTSLGYSYDPGGWFLQAEGAKLGGDVELIGPCTAGYLTLGVRQGAWTPYVTCGKKRMDAPTSNANPIINALLATDNEAQHSGSAGVRWDFRSGMDWKLQVDRVTHDSATSQGALVNPQPAFQRGGSYTVVTSSIDFIF